MTCFSWRIALVATQVFAVVLTHAAAHALIDSSVQLERSARQVVCMDSLFKATPSQPKGPFYAPAALRSNITEGRKGVPLTLTVIVKDKNCNTFPAGTRVGIWHTDANGVYSSFRTRPEDSYVVDERNEDFMRGDQLTDDDGKVQFRTIVPGWYTTRTIHIHLRVLDDENREALVTQLYFDSDFIDHVMEQSPYSDRGKPDTSNSEDMFIGDRPDLFKALKLDIKADGSGAYKATYVVGIDTVVAEKASYEPTATAEESEESSDESTSEPTPKPSGSRKKETKTCFPGSAKVLLRSGEEKLMSELQVGDVILSRPGKTPRYSQVHMFSHREAKGSHSMIRLVTADGQRLVLSPLHYIMVRTDNETKVMKTAEKIAPGDRVYTIAAWKDGSYVVRTDVVQTSSGLYNPHTLDGEIVVNGVWTSCYTASLHPVLSHVALGLFRWVYTVSSIDASGGIFSKTVPVSSRLLLQGSQEQQLIGVD